MEIDEKLSYSLCVPYIDRFDFALIFALQLTIRSGPSGRGTACFKAGTRLLPREFALLSGFV